jgi:quinol monooxygenase YgiN
VITIVAKNFLKPGVKADFIKTAQELIRLSQSEEGCIAYALYEDSRHDDQVAFIEQWRDQAALDAHFVSPHFKQLGAKLGDYAARKMEINIYRPAQG